MTKRKTCFSIALLFIAAPLAFGAVSYSGSVSVALNVGGASVPDVLKVSDRVLALSGFTRGQTSSVNSLTPDHLTGYTRAISHGNPIACNVSLSNKRIIFSFLETPIPNSNSATTQLCNQLATALKERYNGASVDILSR